MAFPRDLPGGFPKELGGGSLGLKEARRCPGADSCRGLGLVCQVGTAPSKWCPRVANTCLCLAIKSVSAFMCFHCIVAVVFGSVIVMGSEATQKCFCEISTPHNPVVQSRRQVGPSPTCSVEGHLQLSCCGPFRRAVVWGLEVEAYPPVSVFCSQDSC